jgi:hypothetical protein
MDKAKSTMKKGLEKVTKMDEERTLSSPLCRLQSSLSISSPTGRQEGGFRDHVADPGAAPGHDGRRRPEPWQGGALGRPDRPDWQGLAGPAYQKAPALNVSRPALKEGPVGVAKDFGAWSEHAEVSWIWPGPAQVNM